MDYLITGATGLLGSHILFELLAENQNRNNPSKINLVIRNNVRQIGIEQLVSLLTDRTSPDYIRRSNPNDWLKQIRVFDFDLLDGALQSNLQKINSKDLIVIHTDTASDLVQGESVRQNNLADNNFKTINLINSLVPDTTKLFVYINSANWQSKGSNFKRMKKREAKTNLLKIQTDINDHISSKLDQLQINYKIITPSVYHQIRKFNIMKSSLNKKVKIRFVSQRVIVNNAARVICRFIKLENLRTLQITYYRPFITSDYLTVRLKKVREDSQEVPEQMLKLPRIKDANFANRKPYKSYVRNPIPELRSAQIQIGFSDITYFNFYRQFENSVMPNLSTISDLNLSFPD